jgi:predicted RNase H-like HicB family nuclease
MIPNEEKNTVRTYHASVWREGHIYVTQCLDIDIVSQGDSPAMALSNLREAVELFFECASEQEIAERTRESLQVAPFEVMIG